MRLELTRVGLLVELANHYTTKGASIKTRVDVEANSMKGYPVFPKAPALLESHHLIILYYIQYTCWGGGSYQSAEMQSVYFLASTDWGRQGSNSERASDKKKYTFKNNNVIFFFWQMIFGVSLGEFQ